MNLSLAQLQLQPVYVFFPPKMATVLVSIQSASVRASIYMLDSSQQYQVTTYTRVLLEYYISRPGNNSCLSGSLNQSFKTFRVSTGFCNIDIRIKDAIPRLMALQSIYF